MKIQTFIALKIEIIQENVTKFNMSYKIHQKKSSENKMFQFLLNLFPHSSTFVINNNFLQ